MLAGHPIEVDEGWVFYNTREFVETGNPSSQLAGNSPIFIGRDGCIHGLPTSTPLDGVTNKIPRQSRGQRHDLARVCARIQETLRFSADALPRFSTRSYSTTWFSLRVDSPARSTAEMWTNTSLSLPFGLMNP